MKKLKKSEVGTFSKAVLSKFIRNPEHFRINKVTDSSVKTLIESMRGGEGHCHPLTVYVEGDKFCIAEGDRRYLAAKELKWEILPYQVVSKQEALLIAVKMNVHRKSLTPLERAEAFKKLMVHYKMKDQKELATAVALTENGISSVMSVLKLPDSIKEQLREEGRGIPQNKLTALSRIADPEAQAKEFAELLAEHKEATVTENSVGNVQSGVNLDGAASVVDEDSQAPESSVEASEGETKPGGETRKSSSLVVADWLEKATTKLINIFDDSSTAKGNNHKNKQPTVSEKNAIRKNLKAMAELVARHIGLEEEPDPEAETIEGAVAPTLREGTALPISVATEVTETGSDSFADGAEPDALQAKESELPSLTPASSVEKAA